MKIVKTTLSIVGLLIVSIVGGMLWEVVLLPFLSSQPSTQDLWFVSNYQDREINLYPRQEITITENDAVIRKVKEVEKSVVGIRTQVGSSFVSGSGLIYTTDGLVITLVELVPYNGTPSVWIDGHRFDAEVVKKDLQVGLAILRVKGDGNYSPASLKDKDIELGEAVFLLGVEFNSLGTNKVVNSGLIRKIDDLIHLNISERASMKGSVIFDLEGRTIGVSKIGIDGEVLVIPISEAVELASL